MTTPPREVPDWDEYFMDIAKAVSRRSKDPSTQHGAVLVDDKHRIIGTGYNGGNKHIGDEELDWGRPAKYEWGVIHAEENALWTSHRRDLDGCTLYVTGRPCSRCMMRVTHSGVARIVYGGVESRCVNEKDWSISMMLAAKSNTQLVEYYAVQGN